MMAIWKSYRNIGRYLSFILVFTWCLALISTAVFAADEFTDEVGPDEIADTGDIPEPGDEPDDTEESYFSNPAQAAHAANLAEASALSDEESEALEQEALAELAEAQKALDAGEISEDEFAEIEAAIDDRLSGLSGVSVGEIGDMRASGMGWGEIAHEIGVHPSVLGLGHQKKAGYTNQEMAEATQRNTKTGYAKGHGIGLDTDSDGIGFAGSKGLKSSNKSGVAGASGLSGNNGKSNSSGSSKGGNGKGNGNNGGGNNGGGNNGGGNNGGGNGKK